VERRRSNPAPAGVASRATGNGILTAVYLAHGEEGCDLLVRELRRLAALKPEREAVAPIG
jgi:hypothetical protein